MKNIYCLTTVFSVALSFGAQQQPPLIKKISWGPEGAVIKMPNEIKDLIAQEDINQDGLDRIKRFLSEPYQGLNPVEATDTQGFSILMQAAESPCPKTRQLIYQFNPSINRICKGRTAFYNAVVSPHPESINTMAELIQLKADIKLGWDETTPAQALEEQLKLTQRNLYYDSSPHHDNKHSPENKKLKAEARILLDLLNKKKELLKKLES